MQLIRIFSYGFISAVYYFFMNVSAPLGIAWRPFHQQRVFNSVNNIVNQNPLAPIGLTSWDSWEKVSTALEAGEKFESYLTSSLPHYLHVLSLNWLDYDLINNYGAALDYLSITLIAGIAAELVYSLKLVNLSLSISSKLLDWFWPVSAFSLFLLSPLTYRMMLAPWHEVPWVGFLLLFYYLTLRSKPVIGIACLLTAGFFHWMWSFLLACFYLMSILLSLNEDTSINAKAIFPPIKIASLDSRYILIVSLVIPTVLINIQLLLANNLLLISHAGSSALTRVGIESASNYHHGGILATIQFLGGNRLSLCLQNVGLSGQSLSIFKFNCFTSIIGLSLISIIALGAYLLACYREKKLRWLLIPLSWAFLTFSLVFQQSTAVHIHGHSFVFVFIYSFGIIYLLNLTAHILRMSDRSTILISAPVILGICINSIRVSYLTGING